MTFIIIFNSVIDSDSGRRVAGLAQQNLSFVEIRFNISTFTSSLEQNFLLPLFLRSINAEVDLSKLIFVFVVLLFNFFPLFF